MSVAHPQSDYSSAVSKLVCGGRKTGVPRDVNQQQTQPTFMYGVNAGK